jgi:DNA repair protein RecN (Recombination protein N)
MIQKLIIKNYALIRDLSMEPAPHLSTITGETGAGKSIMLGGLGLLLGNRADLKSLFESGQKCTIEASFDIASYQIQSLFDEHDLDYLDETIMRREISASGKSRAFINDTPVTLEVMKLLGNYLVDVHSQRDTFLLGSPAYQLHIIDGYAQNANILHEYQDTFKEFKALEKAYHDIRHQASDLQKEADYNHFLLEELEKSAIRDGEQATMEEELKIIEHAEEIKSRLFESLNILEHADHSVANGLQQVAKHLSAISKFAEHFEPLKTRLETSLLEMADITKEIELESHKLDIDKNRQEEVSAKLSTLYQLFQKHGVQSEAKLIEIQEALRNKADRIENLDGDLEAARTAMLSAKNKLLKIAEKLSASRKAVIPHFMTELEALLSDLAMPHATIRIEQEQSEPNATGTDVLRILFSANTGIAPDELKRVASGGEFSRLMFAIKYMLADKTALPTIIFDEIDSGISGEVAMKMVKMMKKMSKRHQVVVITHLPQIAASGDQHYFVYKQQENDRSVSKIRLLEGEARQYEIARMIGGDQPSEAARLSARELLNQVGK